MKKLETNLALTTSLDRLKEQSILWTAAHYASLGIKFWSFSYQKLQ